MADRVKNDTLMSGKRVLVALDVLAGAAPTVLQRALQTCSGADLTVVHVADEEYLHFPAEVAFRSVADIRIEVVKTLRERLETVCEEAGIERRMLLEGRAAAEIRRYAEQEDIDLIVMGAHGRHGWQELVLGSTASGVLHGTPCDVLCVHIPDTVRPYRQVVVAVDLTTDSRSVLGRAVDIAAISGARVSLVSAVSPLAYSYAGVEIAASYSVSITEEAEAHAEEHLRALAASFGIDGDVIVRRGHPATEIHFVTRELSADLVVTGTHGRHGLALVLGSTANGILHGARSDVLAVRVGEAP